MPEQLNERERELALSIIAGMGHSHQEAMLALSAWDKMDVFANLPPDPNLARIAELEAEVERLRGEYSAEVDEFNDGYTAAVAGASLDDEPSDTKHDQWRVGFAWAKYDGLVAEVERLNGLLDEVGEICGVQSNFPFRGHLLDILSRRTAERKEPTDASD